MYKEYLPEAIIVYWELLVTWNHITVLANDYLTEIFMWNHELLVLDWNTWNPTIVCKLFVLDRNNRYSTVCKKTLEKHQYEKYKQEPTIKCNSLTSWHKITLDRNDILLK